MIYFSDILYICANIMQWYNFRRLRASILKVKKQRTPLVIVDLMKPKKRKHADKEVDQSGDKVD